MKPDSLDISTAINGSSTELPPATDLPPLRECVSRSLSTYFQLMENEDISNLYDLVLSEVEAPLLQAVMNKTRSNQTRASHMLGLNRGTLRKKLKQYDLL